MAILGQRAVLEYIKDHEGCTKHSALFYFNRMKGVEIKPPTMGSTLARLKDKGFVTGVKDKGSRRFRYYTTLAGRQALLSKDSSLFSPGRIKGKSYPRKKKAKKSDSTLIERVRELKDENKALKREGKALRDANTRLVKVLQQIEEILEEVENDTGL